MAHQRRPHADRDLATVRRSQAERAQRMQARLLDATIECLFKLGYSGTTTTEIAARAGVSRGAQLHHFPTKEELVIGAVGHLLDVRLAEFRAAFRVLPEGVDTGQVAVDLIWKMFQGPTFYAWLELLVASRTDATLRKAVADITQGFSEEVRNIYREYFTPPPGNEATFDIVPAFLFAVLEGLALEKILSTDNSEAEGVLGLLKQLGNLLTTQTRTQ